MRTKEKLRYPKKLAISTYSRPTDIHHEVSARMSAYQARRRSLRTCPLTKPGVNPFRSGGESISSPHCSGSPGKLMLSNPAYGMYWLAGQSSSAPNSARSSRPSPGQQHWLGGDAYSRTTIHCERRGPPERGAISPADVGSEAAVVGHHGRWLRGRGRRCGYMCLRRHQI